MFSFILLADFFILLICPALLSKRANHLSILEEVISLDLNELMIIF